MSKYASKICDGITPYIAGEQPRDKKYIKLNTNENPYPPSPNVERSLKEYNCSSLKLYSDPENTKLKESIARRYGISVSNIFVGNGSDEVLAMCFPAFCDNKCSFADVTYSFYPVYCRLFGVESDIIPLDTEFRLIKEDYYERNSDMIIITNPNAPTGIGISRIDIECILKQNKDKVIIVDEAYSAFMQGESSVPLTEKYPNLLVVKTFSKAYSLAGARCGYAIGNYELIRDLNKIKNSFNSYTVNSLTELIASEAISDKEYFEATTQAIINTRRNAVLILNRLGFDVLPSQANFVFATHRSIKAKKLYLKLKEAGILVRYFDKPRIDNYLRITIGTDEEMTMLYQSLQKIMKDEIE